MLFTLVDSGLVVYRTYVGSLTRDEEEGYWKDYRVVGRLGLRADAMPRTLADLDDYRRSMLEGDSLFITDWARARPRDRARTAGAVDGTALLETVNFITIALLPDRIRREYGFASVPPAFVRRALVRAGGEYMKRAVVPFLPDRLQARPGGADAA